MHVRRVRRSLVLLPVMATLALSGCWLQPGFDARGAGHNPGEQRLTVADVASLTEAWSATVGTEPVRAPVVSSHGVHVTSGSMLRTYRLADGHPSWSVDVIDQLPFQWNYANSPRVWRGQLIVPVNFYNPTDSSGATLVYDARTGEPGGRRGHYADGSLDGDQFIGMGVMRCCAGEVNMPYLRSTDLADPARQWEAWYFGGSDEESVLSEEWVLSTLGSRLDAFPRTGPTPELCPPYEGVEVCLPAWSVTLGGAAAVPVVSGDDGTVFVGDATGTVSAIGIDDRTVRWSGSAGAPILAAPTVGDGRVFVTSSDGRLTAFDADGCGAATCSPLWSTAATGSPVTTQSALAGGVVYVGSDDGAVRAFDAAGCDAAVCEPLWETSVGSAITGAPAVTLGRLVVGTADGRVIAFEPQP